MVYIDPPYGIRYRSNFQPFIHKPSVSDTDRADELTTEPEMVRAFRDTWELGLHSYLTYLRDRILLARELLTDSGSCFVQISTENLHHVREILDEVFGKECFCGLIAFKKATGLTSDLLPDLCDYLLWYSRRGSGVKFRKLFLEKDFRDDVTGEFHFLDLGRGKYRRLTEKEIQKPEELDRGRVFRTNSAVSPGVRANTTGAFEFDGQMLESGPTRNWKSTMPGMQRLAGMGRLILDADPSRMYKQYWTDFPYLPLTNTWLDVTRGLMCVPSNRRSMWCRQASASSHAASS
jgi:adenine-specific DNA-methyltransferase